MATSTSTSTAGVDYTTHKRGDSLDLVCVIPEEFSDGYFASWTVAAHLRDAKDNLVQELTVGWADETTTRHLRLGCLDTRAWPLGRVDMDVQFTRPDGFVVSTTTTSLYVVKDITRE